MIENKRFTTDNGSHEDICLVDNLTGIEYESNFMDIVNLMNDNWNQTKRFEKHNQELSEKNENLKAAFHREKNTAMKLGMDCDKLFIKNKELEKENEQLKYLLKHSCVTEICENCKYNEYSKYEDCFGIEYDSKCLKGLWEDETHECDGFELKSIEELAKDLRIDFND